MNNTTHPDPSPSPGSARRVSYSTPGQHAKLLRSILRTVEAEPDRSYELLSVIDAAQALADALQDRLDVSARV